ncbi:MAG: hypothetical protein GF364_13730 [Candidatus Lokiarchaeota archaeon]|nr:hypothetical protein [Candidatus Lokiarchaeota archaeon]
MATINSTKKQLDRIRYKYINRVVETRAKKDFKTTVSVLGKKIGPFTAGNHYKLEFWIAKLFINYDILEIVGSDKLDLQNIQKIAYTEANAKEMKKVNPLLFTAIREYLNILASRIKNGFTRERKFKDIYSNVQDLITVRHRKVIRLSQMKLTVRRLQNLTEEEKVLMKSLSQDFKEWKKFFLEDVKKF